MAFEALKTDLIIDITEELQAVGDGSFDEENSHNKTLLASKIRAAIEDVKRARRYPEICSESMIENDLKNYYSNIRSIALFDYNQVGAEGLKSYSADGATLNYIERSKLFYGIIPYGSIT